MLMDMDLMESLMVNLIDNAMKASKEGDTIYVEAAGTCILVEDHGRGIPAEEIPKITEAFYMVECSSKSSGYWSLFTGTTRLPSASLNTISFNVTKSSTVVKRM